MNTTDIIREIEELPPDAKALALDFLDLLLTAQEHKAELPHLEMEPQHNG